MAIPPFDGILNVLPPHLGDPCEPSHLSPYGCTADEFCDRFVTSETRKTIADGFLRLRAELMDLGIRGFQWVDGSYVEDIESQQGRAPGDVDVITFVREPSAEGDLQTIFGGRPDLLDNMSTKRRFCVDHFVIPLYCPPVVLVGLTRYWYGLFSHSRNGVWKGMVCLDLTEKATDVQAWKVLSSKP